MAMIEAQLLKRERGVEMALPYWVVPKANFAIQDMAKAMADNVLPDEDLAAMEDETGATHDFSSVWVVDQQCGRNILGKKVRVIKLKDNVTTQTILSATHRRPYC